MQRKPLRGLVLRALSVSVTTTLVLSGTTAVSNAAPMPAPTAAPRGVPTPTSVWNPPTTVDHTRTGAQSPATPWHPATSPTRASATPLHVPLCESLGLGILQQFPLARYKVDDRMQLAVNLANGNLVVQDNDLSIAGTGQNLAVDHVYNNQPDDSFGSGWTLSVGQDVGLTFGIGGDVLLHGDSGYCVTFAQNADGSYVEPPGLHASLAHNGDGSYTLTFDSTGQKWSFTSDGWLTSQADRNGNANTYRYNSDGTTASVTDSQGRVTQFSYQNGQLTKITDPTGTTAGSYHYNANGKIDAFADRNGFTVKYGYDSNQNLVSLTDPAGGTYVFGYDDSARITKLTLPTPDGNGDTSTYVYSDHQTTETNPLGKASVYHFDDQGRQTSATDPLGHTRNTTWTANSDVQTTADALNNDTTYSYDPLNNYAGTKLPTGASSVVVYTDTTHPHLPTSIKDPQGDELTRSYDAAGNLTTVHSTGLNADIDKRTYNSNGTLATDTDGNGHITSYGYDTAGNLTSVTPPAPARKTSYTYDSLSRISTVTDGNGVQLKYDYDKLDRVVLISQVGGPGLQSYGYDGNGNRVYCQTDTATIRTTFRPRNLIAKSVRDDGVNPAITVSYGYDKADNLTSLTDPSGTTTYGYDAANRLTSQLDPFGQATTFGYDNADHRTSTMFPGAGTQTTGYDTAGRQTSIRFANTAGATLVSVDYSYTRPGGGDSDLMQSKTVGAGITIYSYDPLERLKSTGSNTYSLDNAGNLLSGEGHTFAVNNADQLTTADGSTLGFDGAGNLTSASSPAVSYSYSPTNQLVSGTQSGTQVFRASYDTADQTQPAAIVERVNGTTTTHSFTHTELGISQIADNGIVAAFVHDSKGLLTTLKGLDGKRYNAVTDYQGSVVALIDTSGNQAASYAYSPYGATTATGLAAANPLRWLGQFQLDSGVYLLGYRYYNPSYERFTAPDPTGQERNPYAYAGGQPIISSDPTGAATGAVNACVAAAAGIVLIGVGLATGGVGFVAAVVEGSTLGAVFSLTDLAGAAASALPLDNKACG
jgi:RHS repeat-associated protein